jgi:hypothetical protein
MEKNAPEPLSLVWPAAFLAAAGVAGLSLLLAPGDKMDVLLTAAVLGLTTFLGIVWWSRARAARRWQAVLDAYADGEIARTQRRLVGTKPRR